MVNDRRIFTGISVAGLAVSACAVADMLMRFGIAQMRWLYLIWGAAMALGVASVLLFPKARSNFQALCAVRARLLGLRLALAIALFVLGWYINAASTQLYGEASEMVTGNGFAMFAILFTMVFHVFYFGYTKKGAEAPQGKRL